MVVMSLDWEVAMGWQVSHSRPFQTKASELNNEIDHNSLEPGDIWTTSNARGRFPRPTCAI